MKNESPRVSSLFDGSVYEAFAGGHHLACPIFQARSGGLGGVPVSAGKAKGVVRAVLAGRCLGVVLSLPCLIFGPCGTMAHPKRVRVLSLFATRGVVRARHFISRLLSSYESDNLYWRLRIKSLFLAIVDGVFCWQDVFINFTFVIFCYHFLFYLVFLARETD
jgi:hypothetical protein